MARRVGIATSLLMLCSCQQQNKADEQSAASGSASPTSRAATIAPLLPPPPPHNYDLKEGDAYSYIAALSENDRKAGKAAGRVISFKYLGIEDGKHTLGHLGANGTIVFKARCANPCVIIDQGGGEKIAYNEGSIIGGAFADAIAGRLVVASDAKPRINRGTLSAIPRDFHGLWASNISECQSDFTDSKLAVTARNLAFYESDAAVNSVEIENPRSVLVKASSSGEGETWNSNLRLVLSRSGQDLSIENGGSSFTRTRCPGEP